MGENISKEFAACNSLMTRWSYSNLNKLKKFRQIRKQELLSVIKSSLSIFISVLKLKKIKFNWLKHVRESLF